MEPILILMTLLIPIIMGLNNILKSFVPERFQKLIPLIVGLVLGPLAVTFAPTLVLSELLWAGLLAGMAAGGSYNPTDLVKKP